MWDLIFTGNWVAFAILLVLLLMSALSWAVIVWKALQLYHVRLENEQFLDAYDNRDTSLMELSSSVAAHFEHSPLAQMCMEGVAEARKALSMRRRIEQQSTSVAEARDRVLTNLSRTLERSYNHQTMALERRLPLLAVVSSSAPYIGLFGTVLGIIDAFTNIGLTGVTSLAVVAPGISEALVATAAGLMAAIPALIAYNIFRNRIREVNGQMKNFALDISNRLERIL